MRELRDPCPADEFFVRWYLGWKVGAILLTTRHLNERKPFRQEASAKKDRETAAALADIGITPPEASLFNVVHFGLTVHASDLCRRAAYRDYSVGGPVTTQNCQTALAGVLAKNWLQIVDEATLGRIQDDVRREQLIGPIYGFPSLGGVDFTHAGAEQWFRICERLWDSGHDESFAYCDVVREKSAHYFLSKSRAVAERDSRQEWESVVSVAGPFTIGPWRANWWRRFPAGYRIEVEDRMQWRGRCSGGGGFISLKVRKLPLSRSKDVLDRHNVSWVEWLVMASLEHSTDQREVVRKVTKTSKRLGVVLTEAECLGGLEACVRNGWLRRVDEQITAEITGLLRADSAIMPIPFDPMEHRWRELDFSAEGALLYRMLSAEIFGQDWEDGLIVEASYFREEHRYCATEVGLDAVREEYTESGENPASVRTVPIGPWCVYWWKRFRSGHRMELTFGEHN